MIFVVIVIIQRMNTYSHGTTKEVIDFSSTLSQDLERGKTPPPKKKKKKKKNTYDVIIPFRNATSVEGRAVTMVLKRNKINRVDMF